MVTDIHCHFIPDELFKFARDHDDFALKLKVRDGERIDIDVRGMHFGLNPTFFEPARQIERMKMLGIDRTIISLATPLVNYHVGSKLAVEAARLCNDGFAQAIKTDPNWFQAWAFLPMQDPQAAARELRRCVRDYGFVGGHIASNVRGRYLPDESFHPVFDAARELDVPLFVHPVDPPGKDRTADFELTVVAGYLFESTINIMRMICSNFLDQYGDLKWVVAHTGAFSLMLRNRMQREIDTNASLVDALPKKVGDYLRNLYFDTVCFEPEYLRLAASMVPPDHLLLGSDAPFPLGEPDPVNFVRKSLPPEAAEMVLSSNSARIFGG
jgi:aminocarboxymuconate-semialdehyde decarboxylase